MKIRITGTLEEVEEMEEALKKMPFIRSISSLYKNRGINNEYRLYIETYDLKKEAFQGSLLSSEKEKLITEK